MSAHTHFSRGQRVMVRLKPDGSMIGRFVARKRAAIVIETGLKNQRQHIPISIIKSVGIYKGSPDQPDGAA